MSATTANTAPSDSGTSTQDYWDTPRAGVPDKFMGAIREEPWRGLFEPCIDHPLTEVKVDGEVPKALEGTLFRNGMNLLLGAGAG